MTPSITEAGFRWTDAMNVAFSFFITARDKERDEWVSYSQAIFTHDRKSLKNTYATCDTSVCAWYISQSKVIQQYLNEVVLSSHFLRYVG